MNRPSPGDLEQRTAPDTTVDGRRLRGVIPYRVESRDLGGWREIIEPGALKAANLDDLVATVDHVGIPIGRYPTTLDLEDRDDGAHWSVNLPESRSDVREAVERGDLRAGSWRMKVAKDEWRGDVRHIHEIAELRDVSVVTAPAYPQAVTEFRSSDPGDAQEDTMGAQPGTQDQAAVAVEQTEDRAQPVTGGLHVEDRATISAVQRPKTLADEFRAAGFPGRSGEPATVPFDSFEQRAVTWSGSVDAINSVGRVAGAYGADQRYVWPSVPRVNVDAGATSVTVLTQTARTLASAANVIRAIDAITAKPETSSTLTAQVTALKQVASIQTNVPNVLLEQPEFNTVIEQDLTLAINDGLDKLVLDSTTASGFQGPGTDALIVSVRKAMTTIYAAGYNPDLLVLTPANAETLDTLVSGVSGGVNDYVFSPAQFAPQTIFGMQRRISKTAAAPIVMDSQAFGRLYSSPVSLARFEADAGTTNRGNIRLETHAVFGVERQAAAVRIAAS